MLWKFLTRPLPLPRMALGYSPEWPAFKPRCFASFSHWMTLLFFLAALSAGILCLSYFILTARGGWFFSGIAALIERYVTDGAASNVALFFINITFLIQIIIMMITGILLFRRMKVQVSLLELLTLAIAVGVLANWPQREPSTYTPTFDSTSVMRVYAWISAECMSLLLMGMFQVPNLWLRCVILAGVALGTLAISPWLFMAPQAVLAVFACARHETPLFQRRGAEEVARYWPTRVSSLRQTPRTRAKEIQAPVTAA